jgi:sigma-B regulation protein RsbU (phosphoserine phosphatase)
MRLRARKQGCGLKFFKRHRNWLKQIRWPARAIGISLLALTFASTATASDFQVTAEERAWLDAHPHIRVSPAPNFPPMEFFDDQGQYRGVMADYMAILESTLGITFDIARYDTWGEVVSATKAREADVWMEAQDSPERREFLKMSRPYVHLPVVLIVRRDTKGTRQLADLTGQKVAVIQGYASATFVRDNYPGLELIEVPSIEIGLERVSFGAADVLVANIGAASYYIEKNGIGNLRVAGTSGFEWHLCMAVRKDWPEFFELLQRALDSIETSQRKEIYRQWIALEAPSHAMTRRSKWIAAVSLGLVIFAGWSWRRRRLARVERVTFRGQLRGAVPILTTSACAIAAIMLATMWSRSTIERQARGDVRDALGTVLNTTSQAVYDWLGEREREISALVRRPEIREAALQLADDANVSNGDEVMRRVLSPLLQGRDYDGFILAALDGTVLAAGQGVDADRSVPQPELLHIVDHLSTTGLHAVVAIPERRTGPSSARPLGNRMLIATGVKDDDDQVRCMLTISVNPALDFTEILQRGRIGESGESYAFNRQGQMVSASRFEEELRQIGLIEDDQDAILNVDLRDPGGNRLTGYKPELKREQQPFTFMASEAIGGRSGNNLDGYRDYRGVRVIGAWVWNDLSGLGIVTEIDHDEAFAFLHSYNWQITAGMLLTIALIAGLTGLSIRSRHKIAAAHVELEDAYSIIKRHSDRMAEELNVARDIQMSMVPLIFPAFPDRDEFSIFAALHPAREVGGDFYDFFFVDDHHLCFCIGDVSGKGVPAALFMAVTRTLIQVTAKNKNSPAKILTLVNDELSENNDTSMFVTLFVGILDVRSGVLTYSNAGHNPPYIRRTDNSIERIANRHGPIVGARAGLTYREDTLTLLRGDLLLVYTDGVTEATSLEGNLFTDERLETLLANGRFRSVEDTVKKTVDAVNEFETGADQFDDITVMALRFRGNDDGRVGYTLQLQVRNQIAEIDRVNADFNEFADQQRISSPIRQKVNMLFDELLNNIISYAFADNADHQIDIDVELVQRRLTINIADDGTPFDPFLVADPDTSLPIEERSVGGLGIHLVRKLMDEVGYERQGNKNIVTLIKRLEESQTDSTSESK